MLAGTYTASLEVTNIVDLIGTATNPGFSLKIIIDGTEQPASFTLSTTKAARIYLVVPNGCSTKNLLIKPQIEAGDKKTDWVPNMDKIGTYVDRRFNGINAKLKPILELMDCIEIEN